MQVFVTGASGHLGSAVVPELLDAGHRVVGLARSDASAAAIEKLGAVACRGDLSDGDLLRAQAGASDGVIHLAFRHDLMLSGDLAGAAEADRAALEALAAGLEGSGKPLINTSGTAVLGQGGIAGRTSTEHDVLAGGYRTDAENFVAGLAARGIRSVSIRLTPTVHSSLDHHGFLPSIIAAARAHGYAAYVGDGANRWPAVHTRDAAALYRLAVEKAPAGCRLHAVDDEGVPFAEIAAAIGRHLNLPVRSITPDEAGAFFGFLAGLVQLDNPTSAAVTRELLGWAPRHPNLIADLDEGHYFRA
ncbi:SDR family oxidoreductase [Actinoplanes teichomyceticus]|uniref:Nucleoside-diphosphate-sugar epimerase n=1 Tax=Actinoplanes teichomyceticus TaxID=1867 RepID=A0A561WKL3_ACTTI|nr:SDR family oxidoreductase [Actinoplanes teichomyceticus]TWG24404.1 nucleoside-diphosphate-sugar epimerase [Actinoplanes teichomyceticus]GIF12745.1 oxidoreductase [Actinoplanes teichomyceticus]